jgi:hypothetical protein
MSWYVAEAIFKSTIEGANSSYEPLVEQSWFLVSADDETSAQTKASSLARSKEHAYTNAEGEKVSWVFFRLVRLREIMDDCLADGTEVWSEINRPEEERVNSKEQLV